MTRGRAFVVLCPYHDRVLSLTPSVPRATLLDMTHALSLGLRPRLSNRQRRLRRSGGGRACHRIASTTGLRTVSVVRAVAVSVGAADAVAVRLCD